MVFADHGMALAVVCPELQRYWQSRKVVLEPTGFISLHDCEVGGSLFYFISPEEEKEGMMAKFDDCANKLLRMSTDNEVTIGELDTPRND
jgi:hypothetical protein